MADQAYIPRVPSHVVIDALTGFPYARDPSGELFTLETAADFAFGMNAHMRPEYRAYTVFSLTEVDAGKVESLHAETAARIAAAPEFIESRRSSENARAEGRTIPLKEALRSEEQGEDNE